MKAKHIVRLMGCAILITYAVAIFVVLGVTAMYLILGIVGAAYLGILLPINANEDQWKWWP